MSTAVLNLLLFLSSFRVAVGGSDVLIFNSLGLAPESESSSFRFLFVIKNCWSLSSFANSSFSFSMTLTVMSILSLGVRGIGPKLSTVSKTNKINLEGQNYVHFEVIVSRNVKYLV